MMHKLYHTLNRGVYSVEAYPRERDYYSKNLSILNI